MAQYDTIFKNATVVNHDGEGLADIAVRGGRIAAIAGDAAQVVDCKGLHILPGVIDTLVHFRVPRLTHKEISNAARSAR